MHVLIIPSEEFVPEHNHLAGIFQKHQALALQKAGCQVGVLSVRQSMSIFMLIKAIFFRMLGKQINNELKGKSWGELFALLYNKSFHVNKYITRENIEELDVFRIDGFYFLPPNKHSNHIGWVRAGMQAWQNYCSINGIPDLIHAHNAVYAGLLANTIHEKEHLPYVITEHSSYIARNLESALIRRKIKRAYQQAASFFVVSNFLGEKIDELFQAKLDWKVMPNVLDPEIEKAPMPSIGKSLSPFLFIAIGSLIPVKRHKDLVDAFCKQFAGEKEVELKIAGDGDLGEELQLQISKLNLQNQVKLLGRLSRKRILQLIDNSHCLILCSEIETFAVVLIETLSRGKPVIATRCGGPESIVNFTNGLLNNVGDINGLADSMLYMKEQYSSYDQRQIRIETLAKYGCSSFGKQLKEEYETAVL